MFLAFGSIGGGEVMLILVVALLLFGPRKIPEIGRTLGKTMAEFRKATRDFKLNLEREVDMEDLRNAGDELRSARNDMNTIARDAMTLSPVSSEPPEAAAPGPEKETVAIDKDSKDEAQKNDDGSGEKS
jgi:TatA/E family protein of Tat protein translocase